MDSGRGIPTSINKAKGVSALELVFTVLHAGGKFRNDEEGSGYKTSGGLHGVGASVTNAVSEHLQVWVQRDKKIWTQEYNKGIKKSEVKKTKNCPEKFPGKSGTYIRFKPDKDIFKHIELEWDYDRITRRCREVAFLVPGLKINIKGWEDQEDNPDVSFKYDNGLQDYIDYHMQNKKAIIEKINLEIDLPDIGCSSQIVFAYEDGYDEHITTFANNISTHEGGVHLNAFLNAMLKCIIEIGEREKITKDFGGKVKKSDIQEGMYAIILTRLQQPEFEGQTKTKLGNPEIRQPLEEQIYSKLTKLFERKFKKQGKAIAEKILQTVIARENARKAKDLVRKKGGMEHFTVKGKLADCESKNPEECELFLVEGDSAGGCFVGETEISLVDNRSISFKNLIKEQKKGMRHFTYTIKNDGNIGIEEVINPRITKKNAKVIKIYLDNGESIICTPDHKFMLTDKTYKQAKNLTTKDSLMPLYKNTSSQEMKGYELVKNLKLFEKNGTININKYEQEKKKPALTFKTFCERYFENKQNKAIEAVINYNHKITKIEKIDKLYDVYDVEIPNSHNFALKAGVFVHNSAKQGRNNKFQAILPLRGKVLNVEKTTVNKAMENKELRSLITALNVTPQANGVVPDADDIRFHNVIILADGDPDGAHICCLLITFFYKFMRTLIERGNIKVACPPLYKIKKGKKIIYLKDDEELEKYFKNNGREGVEVNRFKGLGEMNPEQLTDTVLNPSTRKLIQISIEDAEQAQATVEALFGKNVEARKKFLFKEMKSEGINE
jgi:DNA gyrase subunit B